MDYDVKDADDPIGHAEMSLDLATGSGIERLIVTPPDKRLGTFGIWFDWTLVQVR